MYSRNIVLEKLQLVLLDALMVFASVIAAVVLRHGFGVLGDWRLSSAVPVNDYLLPALLASILIVVIFRYNGLYRLHHSRLQEFVRIARSILLGTMSILALTFFYREYLYSRASVILFLPVSIIALTAARNAYRAYRKAVLSNRDAARIVIIAGAGQAGRILGESLGREPAFYHLAGFLDDDPRLDGSIVCGVPVLGKIPDLYEIVIRHQVDEVLIAIPSAGRERVMDLVGECMRLKLRWKFVPDLCEMMLERVHLDSVGGLPLVGLRGSKIVGYNWAMKRAFDLSVASLALVLTIPIWAIIAVAIKLTSRGPVFFRQTRAGLHGRPFTLLKFRSMRSVSNDGIHKDFTADWIYGRTGDDTKPRPLGADAVHKISKDPRITWIGRILRKTSLDELPQIWNVLRGEMSIVGPRPPIPYEVERYTEWHKRRLDVLPGITGLWQVSGRNALSFEEMVRLDIEYIENWSFEQDLRIVLRTIPALLFGKAY